MSSWLCWIFKQILYKWRLRLLEIADIHIALFECAKHSTSKSAIQIIIRKVLLSWYSSSNNPIRISISIVTGQHTDSQENKALLLKASSVNQKNIPLLQGEQHSCYSLNACPMTELHSTECLTATNHYHHQGNHYHHHCQMSQNQHQKVNSTADPEKYHSFSNFIHQCWQMSPELRWNFWSKIQKEDWSVAPACYFEVSQYNKSHFDARFTQVMITDLALVSTDSVTLVCLGVHL